MHCIYAALNTYTVFFFFFFQNVYLNEGKLVYTEIR